MDALKDLFANPAGLIALACLAGVVLIANAALFALLRGATLDLSRFRRSLATEASLWRRAITGGRDARAQQTDDLNELHQLVSQLRPPGEAGPTDQPPAPPA